MEHFTAFPWKTLLKTAVSLISIFLGGNRRTQGRRGGYGTRTNKPRTGGGPVKFEGEFDFESSNAKFNKDEIEEELQQKLHENLRITDEVNSYTCILLVCTFDLFYRVIHVAKHYLHRSEK